MRNIIINTSAEISNHHIANITNHLDTVTKMLKCECIRQIEAKGVIYRLRTLRIVSLSYESGMRER
jgi:hypothetical protein